jgi:hypothetical protein
MLSFFENIVICNYDCPVNKCTSIFHFEKLLNCMYCLFLILQLTSIQEHDRAIFCPLLSLHRFSLNTVWRQVITLCNCLILYVTTYLLYFILFHCEIATYYIFMTKVIWYEGLYIATIFTALVLSMDSIC